MFVRTFTSNEIRRAIDIYSKIKSFRKVAIITGIGKSTIHRWWTTFHTIVVRGKVQKNKKRKRKLKYPSIYHDLKGLFSTTRVKFFSLKSIQAALPYPNKPCLSWIFKALRTARISRRRFNDASVCPRSPDALLALYKNFKTSLDSFNDDEIICIDETSFCNVGNVHYGYFNKGQHPEDLKVQKRQRVSVIAAIHPSHGIVCHQVLCNQAFNKDAFLSFLKGMLIPSMPKGTKALLMDNVAFHRSKVVVETLNEHNIQCIYIPPYSPRCNPIEEVFSHVKRQFRGLDTCLPFSARVEDAMKELKLYKDIIKHYNHTRSHIHEVCLRTSES
jgi:transposase